jgi:hypothetical protein
MSKIARLAATKGGKTRAILKLAGRSAIVLTVGAFSLANWMLWAIVTAFGLVSALKRMTERATERSCARRRLRRARQQQAREQAERRAREQGPRPPMAEGSTVIAFPAPTLVPTQAPECAATPVEPTAIVPVPFARAASGVVRQASR